MNDSYTSDRSQADRSLKERAEFIIRNIGYLRRKDPKRKKESEVRRILEKLEGGYSPVDWERRIIDEANEKVMAAAGLQSMKTHGDRRKRSLRYGH
jgi:hypothetical protein